MTRKYAVDEGLRYHAAQGWAKVICFFRGHDPITKFDGTVLCRRCH